MSSPGRSDSARASAASAATGRSLAISADAWAISASLSDSNRKSRERSAEQRRQFGPASFDARQHGQATVGIGSL